MTDQPQQESSFTENEELLEQQDNGESVNSARASDDISSASEEVSGGSMEDKALFDEDEFREEDLDDIDDIFRQDEEPEDTENDAGNAVGQPDEMDTGIQSDPDGSMESQDGDAPLFSDDESEDEAADDKHDKEIDLGINLDIGEESPEGHSPVDNTSDGSVNENGQAADDAPLLSSDDDGLKDVQDTYPDEMDMDDALSDDKSASFPDDHAETETSETSIASDLTDETGIDSDALWEDDDESDDVSLFEDALIEEELKIAEQAREEETGAESGTPEDTSQEKAVSLKDDEPLTDGQDRNMAPEPGPGPGEDAGGDNDSKDESIIYIGAGSQWITWAVTAFSTILTVTGGVVLWMLASSPLAPPPAYQPAEPHDQQAVSRPAAEKTSAGQILKPEEEDEEEKGIKRAFNITTLNLSPFLIPVQKDGELVFLKLRVELILPDQNTLIAIRKRKAWVRDAIYMVLKGIEIKPGMRGDILMRYRRPVLERLNRELAPLEVQDIRLTGVMLK